MTIVSATLPSWRMAFDDRGNPFTLYDVCVTLADGTSWTTEKRFSDFKRLSQQLTDRHRSDSSPASPNRAKSPTREGGSGSTGAHSTLLPELPKGILSAGWLGGLSGVQSPEFLKRRQKGLHTWLGQLLRVLPVDDALLLHALSAPPRVRQMLQANAPAAASATPAACPGTLCGGSDTPSAATPAGSVPTADSAGRPHSVDPRPCGPSGSSRGLCWDLVWETREV
jgi:hypothetical protein